MMGRGSKAPSSAAGAIIAVVLGISNFFPTGVLLLGSTLLWMPTENGVHSFSAVLPKHLRSPKQQSKWNQGKTFLGARSETEEDTDDEKTTSRRNLQYDDVFCFAPKNNQSTTNNRRRFFRDQIVAGGSLAAASLSPQAASAKNPKSRTEGYAVQRTEREWAYVLSGAQYNVLRRGGTERQKSSILNTFTASDNVGTYVCAACPTALFDSASKFKSGTGWPSFAKALEGVEIEAMDPISATLGGREVRCGTCGGHLGDLFNDGWVYVGSQAFETGNRFCIDGAALVFKPADGGADIYGDIPPPNKVINYEPAIFKDKSINSQS